MKTERLLPKFATIKSADPWLLLIWVAVLIIGPVAIALFAIGLPLLYRQLLKPCPGVCDDFRLTAVAAAQWEAAGLSSEAYALAIAGLAIGLALVCFVLAALLLWRRPFDRMAVLTALLFILLGATYSNADELVGELVPGLFFLAEFINQLGFTLFPILLLTLPDGHFVPNWTRWLAVAIILVGMTGLGGIGPQLPETVFFVFLPIWGLSGPITQIYRYKWRANPLQRQQLKWVATGTSVGIIGFVTLVFIGVMTEAGQEADAFTTLATTAALHLFIAIIPISVGIGILRYRLFDIDIIIRKTLVYSLLSGSLALVYFGAVLLLQTLFGSFTNAQSPIVLVLSTLLIAALFAPLRRRIQAIIDRRFFRSKYDAQQVLAQFAQTARDEVDIDRLTAAITAAIHDTMQPRTVSVWLRKSGTGRKGYTP